MYTSPQVSTKPGKLTVFDDDRMCHDKLELTTLTGLNHGDLLFDRTTT